MFLFFLLFIFVDQIYHQSFGSLVAVSKIEECFNVDGEAELLNEEGNACGKKMVVALTLTGNESKSQYLEANISLVTNYTTNQRQRVKKPFRIRIEKSPVKIQHRLHLVGEVNHHPQEASIGQLGVCRDDWYSEPWEAACGFQYDDTGGKLFDSQGFCCECHTVGTTYWRAASSRCHYTTSVAHCLRKHWLSHRVFDLYPARKDFSVDVIIEEYDYGRTDGSEVWRTRGILHVGPNQRVVKSEELTIKVEYIGDLASARYGPNLQSKYLLVPHLSAVKASHHSSDLYRNMSEARNWLLVDRHLVDLTGLFCDKIGTDYQAFRNQPNRCHQPMGSCLQGQPHHLYTKDIEAIAEGRRGSYLLGNFGRIPPMSSDLTVLELISTDIQKSLITITMEADNLKSVVNTSPGRIVDCYIDAFEALSMDGTLTVLVENIGYVSASYQVAILHCSAGIEYIPAQTIILDPAEVSNLTFTLYSFHAISQINRCEVELYDEKGILLDNQTVSFTTFDTCFCHGYCGCSCGDNTSNCPPPPDLKDSLTPNDVVDILQFFEDLGSFLQTNLGAMIIGAIIIKILIILGILKVIMMIATGEIKCQYLWMAIGAIIMATTGIPMFATNLVKGQLEQYGDHGQPARCDGMCQGAKKARREHRKKLRIKKRRGKKVKDDDVWWKEPYQCNCRVKETKTILEIIKGTCFFLYCPLLPIIWILQFAVDQLKRRRRRQRRKQAYRAAKAKKRAGKKTEFLSMDDYSRGKKTKKKLKTKRRKKKEETIVEIDVDINNEDEVTVIDITSDVVDLEKKHKVEKKTKKSKKRKADNRGEHVKVKDPPQTKPKLPKDFKEVTEDELKTSSDSRSCLSDTSDEEEAMDLDELLEPGYPVYLNFSSVDPSHVPHSLQNPGDSFSIKGRLKLVEDLEGVCVFDIYKYIHQTHKVVKNRKVSLKASNVLNPEEFTLRLDVETVLQVITLAPLFPSINASKVSVRADK